MCDFKIGAYREDTTPPVGTLLYGYRPDLESKSVHDNLSVTVMAVSDGKSIALMVTAELGDINNELCEHLRSSVSEKCAIPYENIMISCTHTHSAPNLSGVAGWGEIDRDYYNNIFMPSVITASTKAIENLQPAEIAVGVTKSEVGINRRQQHQNGEIGLGQNPHGCFDPNMTVISIRNSETKDGILNIIHYGCHGTASGLTDAITRDWSGVMIDRLEKETQTLTAFWNGAIGDVGPRLTNGETTGDLGYMEELGGVAAADAVKAYKAKSGYHKGELKIFKDFVNLPRKEIPTLDEIERKLASFKNPECLINIERLEYEHYKDVYELHLKGVPQSVHDFSFQQTIISLGDIVFIPFPFEMFSEIALRLREYSTYPYTLCLSCTNGYNVYLPSEDQLCRGGYEVGCFMYGHIYPLADNTDHYIINENLRIINENK